VRDKPAEPNRHGSAVAHAYTLEGYGPFRYPCLRKYNQAITARITAGNRLAISGGTP